MPTLLEHIIRRARYVVCQDAASVHAMMVYAVESGPACIYVVALFANSLPLLDTDRYAILAQAFELLSSPVITNYHQSLELTAASAYRHCLQLLPKCVAIYISS
jgi:hypothetical protein